MVALVRKRMLSLSCRREDGLIELLLSSSSRLTTGQCTRPRVIGKRNEMITQLRFSASSSTPGNVPGAKVVKQYLASSPHTVVSKRVANASTNTWTHHKPSDPPPSWPLSVLQGIFQSLFLPADYDNPHSVRPNYINYSMYMTAASMAGSASLAMSTAVLLQATFSTGSSSIIAAGAGAYNWVLKDALGKAAGIGWNSHNSSTYDQNPKRWKVKSAIIWDSAALLEVLLASCFISSSNPLMVMILSSAMKGIVSVTEGASRAKIHKHFALRSNLADVTAKTASQSLVAGIAGTLLAVNVPNDASHLALLMFVFIHQWCTHRGLQHVVFDHFNAGRLLLVLSEYLKTGLVLKPSHVAAMELSTTTWLRSSWLIVGSDFSVHGLKPSQVDAAQPFLLTKHANTGKVHVTFARPATPQDVILGVLKAIQLRENYDSVVDFRQLVIELELEGWCIDSTDIESKHTAHRFEITEE